jgi:hypothetical protein
LSGNLKNTKEHNVSETDPICVFFRIPDDRQPVILSALSLRSWFVVCFTLVTLSDDLYYGLTILSLKLI